MDIREKFRSDMALATATAEPESAIAQRVVRRRKPAIAQPVTDLAEEAVPIEAPMEELKPVIAVEPRTIRRRPIPAPPTQLAPQQPISLTNIPITINKQ